MAQEKGSYCVHKVRSKRNGPKWANPSTKVKSTEVVKELLSAGTEKMGNSSLTPELTVSVLRWIKVPFNESQKIQKGAGYIKTYQV